MTHQLSPVCLPCCDLVLAGDRQMDGIDHDAVSCRLRRSGWGYSAIGLVEESLIIARLVIFMEPSGQAKVGQLDVTVFIYEDI